MPVYLDCAATTPIDPAVLEVCVRYLRDDFGNAASRTHGFGASARKAVERARDQVAAVCGAGRGDIVFTSGATESNNLAILGLEDYGREHGRRHLVSTAIEHSAVLEPLQVLARRGFALSLVRPGADGRVSAEAVADALRPDTLLVSVMQVNNETGVRQPLAEIAERLGDHPAFFHTDAAQGFGKEIESLRHPRIDLISLSGHKLCAPKGVGALVMKRRGGKARAPLQPLLHGGGQERGFRPGTAPVALIAALGEAAELWSREAAARWEAGVAFRAKLLEGLAPLEPVVNGDPACSLPFIVNVSFPQWESGVLLEEWSPWVAASDGAACSSAHYTCSHVLSAMGVEARRAAGAVRFSWCHLTPMPDTSAMVAALQEVPCR